MNRATPSGVPGADPVDRRVIVVDDEQSIREAIGRFLRARGFDVVIVDSGAAALEQLRASKFAAMLCDVRMPGMTGLEMLPGALKLEPDLAVLMLTGLNDASTATEALAQGAMDYLLKPIELDRLELAIAQALQRRSDRIDARDVAQLVREEVDLRTAELEREKLALRGLTVSVLESVVTHFEARDARRAGHSQRVAALARDVARAMRLDDENTGHIHLAARLHDVGMIALPDALLRPGGELSASERTELEKHVAIGVQILTPIRHAAAAIPFVRDHHERWDGKGYPAQLRGDQISLGGRIIAAADAFVGATSAPYSTAADTGAVLKRLEADSGAHFDPEVFRALAQVVRSAP
ncbi:MAG TPA: HD domain-containing phosphohydrolase [Gemmatimonadaceae bacterium]|nr:HD domain-containing phosphohydrolase [Gemmatimonadaceae bacterium]